MDKRNKIISIILLQAAVLIFALSSVAGKFASKYEFLSISYILFYALEIILLGIYALAWQQIIKKVDISIAYSNKATNIFWGLILAFLIFKENISLNNIIGVIIIFVGVLLVNRND